MSYHKIQKVSQLHKERLQNLLREALREDIGNEDITTQFVIPKNRIIKAVLLAKEDCVICGLGVASSVFAAIDEGIKIRPLVSEGQFIKKGKTICRIQGKAQGILAAERVAINFLSLLSGIATETKKYVDKASPYRVKVMDTRKTIPGLRELQKYAVRVGGGFNHRMRLDEMALIKDNHIKVTKSVPGEAQLTRRGQSQCPAKRSSPEGGKVTSLKDIVAKVRGKIPKKMKIEVEVKSIREFKEALKAHPDIIMLDNMGITDIKKAVAIKRDTQYSIRNTLIEASGGINLRNIRRFASCGVDMISVGGITHSVKSVDISLEVI